MILLHTHTFSELKVPHGTNRWFSGTSFQKKHLWFNMEPFEMVLWIEPLKEPIACTLSSETFH